MTPDGVHFSVLFLGEGKDGQTNMGWVIGFRCVVYLRSSTPKKLSKPDHFLLLARLSVSLLQRNTQ